jgi:cell division septum initiation protein DivIVA
MSIVAGAQEGPALLLTDPAKFHAEIQRYEQARAQAEEKLKHISDLNAIGALKRQKESELEGISKLKADAEEIRGAAKTEAQKLLVDAKAEARAILEKAVQQAAKLRESAATASNIAEQQRTAAEQARIDADAVQMKLTQALDEARKKANEASAAQALHNAACKRFNELHASLQGAAQSLQEALSVHRA